MIKSNQGQAAVRIAGDIAKRVCVGAVCKTRHVVTEGRHAGGQRGTVSLPNRAQLKHVLWTGAEIFLPIFSTLVFMGSLGKAGLCSFVSYRDSEGAQIC